MPCSSTSATTTRAPSRARASAMARPIPLAPPVTTAPRARTSTLPPPSVGAQATQKRFQHGFELVDVGRLVQETGEAEGLGPHQRSRAQIAGQCDDGRRRNAVQTADAIGELEAVDPAQVEVEEH